MAAAVEMLSSDVKLKSLIHCPADFFGKPYILKQREKFFFFFSKYIYELMLCNILFYECLLFGEIVSAQAKSFQRDQRQLC